MNKHLSILFFLLISIAPIFGQGPVKFYASTNARQVVLGNYFEIDFTLENVQGENFQAPTFTDFEVLNGPSQSTSVSSVNGKWSRTISFSYTLRPKKIGKFTIGPASVVADGKTIRSNRVSVEVVKGKKNKATTQEEIDQQIRSQVFVRAEVNDTQAAIGEQVILDYKLYTTRDIDSYHVLAESDYPGFFARDIRRYDSRIIKEVYEGVQYSTKVLKRIALFPQQAGLLTVDPMQLQLSILVDDEGGRRRRSFFYTPNVNRVNVNTDALDLSIRPLPDNPPPTFTGAVGKYMLQAQVDRVKLTTDDAITLRMTVSGTGDIKRVLPPPLLLSKDSFEVYEPRVIEENTFETQGRVTGKKIIEYLVLPRFPGRYRLQPKLSYFDTDSLVYLTTASQPFPLIVTQGLNKKRKPKVDSTALINQAAFHPIRKETSLFQRDEDTSAQSIFYVLMGLPLLLLGGVVVYRQIQANKGEVDLVALRSSQAKKLAEQKLSQAKTYLDEQKSKAFYDEISKGMLGYICDKLNIPLAELSKQNVETKLRSLNVGDSHITRFMEVITNCELALFAGKDNASAMSMTYDNAIKVVADIEEEILNNKN